jgi:hypothetical protein
VDGFPGAPRADARAIQSVDVGQTILARTAVEGVIRLNGIVYPCVIGIQTAVCGARRRITGMIDRGRNEFCQP